MIICYVTHVTWNAHLWATDRNILTLFKWEPVIPPPICTLHALTLATSHMPPAYHNITLQDLVCLSNQELDTYYQQADEYGDLDDYATLIHIVSIQELWREWNSAKAALSWKGGLEHCRHYQNTTCPNLFLPLFLALSIPEHSPIM